MLLSIVLQAMRGGRSLVELIGGYKNVAGSLIAVGFFFAALGVVKKSYTHPEKMKGAIINYCFALVTFLLIWSMV